MPLTSTGHKILGAMKKTYKSARKAKSVFYASINAGKIDKSKVEQAKHLRGR